MAIRAGILINWSRIVAARARACVREARTPAVLVRLNAIAARTVHALLAEKDPEGAWASGPDFKSAMTCSMIAWSRWDASACSMVSGESVKTAWWR